MTQPERDRLIGQLAEVERQLSARCDRLRDYATRAKAKEINVYHFANAVIKVANEIAGGKS